MIREAEHGDIPWLLEMGRAFAQEAGVIDRVGWSDEAVVSMLESLIDNEGGILLRSDNGMIGGVVYPHPFSGELVFQEMFWRSHGPGEGVRLLNRAEEMAREMGATRSIMIGMASLPDLAGLYGRMDYSPIEQLYCKEL